jgi:hypothetical protein
MARKVQIAVIKDNRPAGDFTDHDLPREGKFDDPQPVRRRLGVAKDWEIEFRVTDPIVCHLIAAEYE